MRLFIPLLFLLCSCLCAAARDYTYYYQQIQLAENNLFNGKFETALKHYDAAFSKYEFKFARDCYVAAQVAAFLKNDPVTYRYLSYCLQAGITYNCLYKSRVLKDFANSSYGQKLAQDKDKLYCDYVRRIDTTLHKEFARRYDTEQFIKNKGGTPYYDVVDDNFDRIKYLLLHQQYPGEQLIGMKNTVVVSKKPAMFGQIDCAFGSELALPTLLHFPYSIDSLDKLLVKARDQGYLSQWEYVSIYIFSCHRHCTYRNSKFQGVRPPIIFNLPFEKFKTDTATANANRAKYYLPRIGNRLNRDSLLYNYGIAVGVGDYADMN